MKQGKFSAFLEKINQRIVAGKPMSATTKKRLAGACAIGGLVGALLIGTGVYNHTTRHMVEEANQTMMGNDYVEWIREQIGEATAQGMAAYVTAEEGVTATRTEKDNEYRLSDLINHGDIEAMSDMILTEIDRRYEETGDAFSEGQKDQLNRLVQSELNSSIEDAMTSLMEQNRENLTEETYHYVAEYVTKNMDSVLKTANLNEAAIQSLQKDTLSNTEKVSTLMREAEAWNQRLEQLNTKQVEEDAYAKTTGNRVTALESDTALLGKKLDAAGLELETAKTQLSNTNLSLASLEQTLTATKKDFNAADTKLAALENSLQGSLKISGGMSLKEACTSLISICTELQSKASELETKIREKEAEIRDLTEVLKTTETDLKTTQTDIKTTRTELEAAKTDMQKMKTEMAEADKELKAGIDKQQAEVDALKSGQEALESAVQEAGSDKVIMVTMEEYGKLAPKDDVLYVITG